MHPGEEQAMGKIPKLADLMDEAALAEKEKGNALLFLLNQDPPAKWLKELPGVTVKKNGVEVPFRYLPIERVYFLLNYIYGGYTTEIKWSKQIANSVEVCARVIVTNPITRKEEYHEGIGAAPMQTAKGANRMEFEKIHLNSVQMSAPAAKTFAFKDACENFGKIFGRDLNVADVDYANFEKPKEDTKVKVKEGSAEWQGLVQNLIDGIDIKEIEKKVDLTKQQINKLLKAAL